MIIDLTTVVDSELMETWLKTQENRHIATGHIGTHLDVYDKSEIPLEYFRSPGILIDVSHIAETREVEVSDLENVEIPMNGFVLFRTTRSEKEKYGTADYFDEHPQLSHELIEYLANEDINFIGIDCSGIRRGREHVPADKLCESKGTYVIENLSKLDELVGVSKFNVYTLWFDDEVATGLRCRVLAEVI